MGCADGSEAESARGPVAGSRLATAARGARLESVRKVLTNFEAMRTSCAITARVMVGCVLDAESF